MPIRRKNRRLYIYPTKIYHPLRDTNAAGNRSRSRNVEHYQASRLHSSPHLSLLRPLKRLCIGAYSVSRKFLDIPSHKSSSRLLTACYKIQKECNLGKSHCLSQGWKQCFFEKFQKLLLAFKLGNLVTINNIHILDIALFFHF